MSKAKGFAIVFLLALYFPSFIYQERFYQDVSQKLAILPSASFLRATAGYLRQLVAEVAFVQSGVFLGGVKPGVPPDTYAKELAHNYLQITTLYPQFQDPYFYTQSYVAYAGQEYSAIANDILDNGRKAYPENLIFPFFQAFNYFYHLGEPLQAAEIFRQASMLPKAPPMFAHLAAILPAEGGALEAAIISLTALIKSTDDPIVKRRYEEEVEAFRSALGVQRAVTAYFAEQHHHPNTLEELIPKYIEQLPDIGPRFELTWNPPVVGVRPFRPKPVK